MPKIGRYILAQFDGEGVIVYQAYRPEIGHFAATHGYFGGDHFSTTRMSWIKPNFLWMMYRSGWGQKEGQEVVLAVKIKREAFDTILANAVRSSYNPDLYPTEKEMYPSRDNSRKYGRIEASKHSFYHYWEN
ncbi:hypothetical protein Cha6605_0114 [Chamaesiphon minutus PCC 6605]|uniref:DUF4291 domain-containing protein n=1 Tax=Chamaesiphon minutus (strain ATCC 27169 / PCC 6605) TaxID=1173020 RepID=K9UAH3_CHAP6|nr:hypothetical protein Cha6605_0114 [Chamaesiphon minutus PCC 6605]